MIFCNLIKACGDKGKIILESIDNDLPKQPRQVKTNLLMRLVLITTLNSSYHERDFLLTTNNFVFNFSDFKKVKFEPNENLYLWYRKPILLSVL